VLLTGNFYFICWQYGHDHLGDLMNFEQISKYLYSDYFVFEKTISVHKLTEILAPQFENTSIKFTKNILQSFVHKSFRHETKIDIGHNEKLEFLGDSVLQIIISEKLFNSFPDKTEGELSKLRSAIVNETSLAEIALVLGINKFILLGKGEFREEGHKKNSILADTFEALLGAIYLDTGLKGSEDFMDFTIGQFEAVKKRPLICDNHLKSFDAKTKFQELVVKKYKMNPEYKSTEVEKNGTKQFLIELVVNQVILDKVHNQSKKKGMQELAKRALENNLINI
jgi:ribonuclease-3